MTKVQILVLLSIVFHLPSQAWGRSYNFDAYAPPVVFGQWYDLPGHLGAVTYTVKYKVVGNTVVTGEVKYFDAAGKLRTMPFSGGEVTFRTGESVAQPKIRFKGVPTGSVVRVIVGR
jgi:hypothetical protein